MNVTSQHKQNDPHHHCPWDTAHIELRIYQPQEVVPVSSAHFCAPYGLLPSEAIAIKMKIVQKGVFPLPPGHFTNLGGLLHVLSKPPPKPSFRLSTFQGGFHYFHFLFFFSVLAEPPFWVIFALYVPECPQTDEAFFISPEKLGISTFVQKFRPSSLIWHGPD